MDNLFLRALTLTVISETVVVAALISLRRRRVVPWHGLLPLVVNLVSHPIFWFTLPHLPLALPARITVAEGLVILAEALAYRRLAKLHLISALAFSAAANLLSIRLGALWL